MIKNQHKNLRLLLEFERATKLLDEGFVHLKKINEGNDFYELALFCFSNGLERLFKSTLVKYYIHTNNTYPKQNEFWKNGNEGHDLLLLKSKLELHFKALDDSRFKLDTDYFKNVKLISILKVLSIYGQKGRFSDMDVVLAPENKDVYKPKEEWEKIETLFCIEDGVSLGYVEINNRIEKILRNYLAVYFRQLHYGKYATEFKTYWAYFQQYFTVEPITKTV